MEESRTVECGQFREYDTKPLASDQNLPTSSAHHQPTPQQRWLSYARRHALAAFAAHADAFVQREVVADAGNLGEHGGAVADQRCALDRGAELAVFDAIGFGAREDELARDDVDLPAAEALGEDAVPDAAQQFCRIIVARVHEGVGHARHRGVGVGLAAAVA